MARKKSKKVVLKKAAKPKLDTSFSCPFCNEENSVDCKLDRSKSTGTAKCRACHAGYQTIINYLSDPIDVFAEWVDAIETQEKQRAARRQKLESATEATSGAKASHTSHSSDKGQPKDHRDRTREEANKATATISRKRRQAIVSDEEEEENDSNMDDFIDDDDVDGAEEAADDSDE